jgi:hypothetical protein
VLGWVDALHASAVAWARYADGEYVGAGAREFLEYSLQGAQGSPTLAYAIREDVDEPGSSARGRAFLLETVHADEIDPDALGAILADEEGSTTLMLGALMLGAFALAFLLPFLTMLGGVA